MAAKSDAVVKLILVFVISLLSFAVGTFVGKKYSDQQHKMAAYEPTSKEEHGREVASEKASGDKASTMTDDEIAKIAEEFVTDDSTEGKVAAKGEAKAETHAAGEAAAEKSHEPKTEAKLESKGEAKHEVATKEPVKEAIHQAPAHEVAPSKAALALTEGHEVEPKVEKQSIKEPRLPAALPKNVAQYPAGKYTVQVASFGTEGDAKKRAEELKAKGYSAFYIKADVNGKTWYRVSVGEFANENEAKAYRTGFMQKAKIESAIIQKMTN